MPSFLIPSLLLVEDTDLKELCDSATFPFFPLQYALLENLIDQTTANVANDAYDVCKGNQCSCIVFNVTHEIFYHQKLLILSLSALPVGLLDIHLWPVAFVECQVCAPIQFLLTLKLSTCRVVSCIALSTLN